jgi:hypothetical protein
MAIKNSIIVGPRFNLKYGKRDRTPVYPMPISRAETARLAEEARRRAELAREAEETRRDTAAAAGSTAVHHAGGEDTSTSPTDSAQEVDRPTFKIEHDLGFIGIDALLAENLHNQSRGAEIMPPQVGGGGF